MIKNTKTAYGLVSITLHWTMSILIICMLGGGLYMTSLEASDDKWYIYGIHKAIGTLILALVIIRITWRFYNVWPGLPSSVPRWQVISAKLSILSLYVMMLVMPITGFFGSLTGGHDISFFGLFIIPSIAKNQELSKYLWEIHERVPYIFIASIILHFLAAMYHHFIMKDYVLKRMLSCSVNNIDKST